MKTLHVAAVALASLAIACGCRTSYSWTSSVPKNMRTISVPTFLNQSDVTELGSVVSRQVLREIQREGTFRVALPSDAAVEVQGVITSAGSSGSYGDRHTGMRLNEYIFTVTASVSVIDKVNGKVLINNRNYTATTTFVGGQDIMTGLRNASGRVAEDLALQVVDDLTSMQW